MIPLPDPLIELPNLNWFIQAQSNDADPLPPWSSELVQHIDELSRFIFAYPEAKQFPEIIALAFWCRAANIRQIQQQFVQRQALSENTHCPAPKVFHIAPANVDTVFFYTLILSLLAGNQNIVRISQRSGEVTNMLIRILQQFLYENPQSIFTQWVSVVEYDATENDVTARLSRWCDLRVLWGGDNAIQAISHIEPQTQQIAFPDRYSVALIKIDNETQVQPAVDAFITDILPFKQQACSSPKALFWWQTEPVWQQAFYESLGSTLSHNKQQFELADQVEQVFGSQYLMMITSCQVNQLVRSHGLTIMTLQEIDSDMLAQHRGHGLLLACQLEAAENLPFADKLQTIACYGVAQPELDYLRSKVPNTGLKRVAPLGKALEFNPVWDGVDLCRVFSLSEQSL